ncbi:MAG: phosphoribosyltransferase [Actinomycetota bacterium]|nr:phosphoribosyltransferase [Actinomycetota bacterium]
MVPCRNAPVQIMLVRAADIPEYVQDGVVDCGITGADLVRERDASVTEVLSLGYGSCSLEAAVPESSEAQTFEDISGWRVATTYPHVASRFFEERGIDVSLVDVSGSVEVAPRLGLADAIVDLVSSGNTLRTNGLRSIGSVLSSEAVLITKEDPPSSALALGRVLQSVVAARDARYLMFNAPEAQLQTICDLVPSSRSPSIVPLAEPGMVAVHSLVPAAEVWRLLPRIHEAGASSILLLPIERMLP